MLSKEQGSFLVNFARETIKRFVSGEETPLPKKYPKEMDKLRGVFVTLEEDGELRGCIGLPYPDKPLIDAVRDAACSAARDPRFSALTERELKNVKVEISVLTKPEQVKFSSPEDLLKKIKPGRDGLILKKGWFSGLFLPQVWEHLPRKQQFLENLCYKAGLSDPDGWKKAEIFRFRVQAFKEKKPGVV